MSSSEKIDHLVKSLHITEEQAKRLLKAANDDVDLAITLHNRTKDEMYVGSGLAVNKPNRKHKITIYKNGMIVNGKFIELKKEEIANLKHMMQNGEFDARMVGGKADEMAEFELESHEDVDYTGGQEPKKEAVDFSKCPSVGKRIIPKFISMDKSDQSVSMQIFFEGVSREIRVSKKCLVKDLLTFMFKYTKKNLALLSEGKKISEKKYVVSYSGKDLKIENE